MKYLILEYLEIVDDNVTFKINDQSHRGFDFGNNGNYMSVSNTITLISDSHPAVYNNDHYIYVRGGGENKDNNTITVSSNKWNRIKEAVKEYNTYFGYHGECIIGEVPEIMVPMEMFELD